MALARKQRLFTPQEYLLLEREAPYKSEYVAGEIFAMAGANTRHNVICANLVGLLWAQLKDGPCQVFGSDHRTAAAESALYTYPDVSILCGPPEYADLVPDTLTNPRVIFEVLSPSTEAYDRGEKFERYRQIATLTDYVLISQDQPRVEHRLRQDGGVWITHEYTGLAAQLPLNSAHCSIPLADLYYRA